VNQLPGLERIREDSQDLAAAFRDAGFSLYAVGGCVRDAFMSDASSLDVDYTTNARPDDILRLLRPLCTRSEEQTSLFRSPYCLGCRRMAWFNVVSWLAAD